MRELTPDNKGVAVLNRILEAENAKYTEKLQDIPPHEWPSNAPRFGLVRVLRSRDWLVQVFLAHRPALVRLSINRTRLASAGKWRDGITWEELQAIKNEAGYADVDAVEIFPRAADVVNVSNMRHLWVLAGDCPFAWRMQETANV